MKDFKDVYSTPKSELEIDKYQSIVDKLSREESYILSIFAAVLGTVLGILVLANIPGRAPLLVFALPAFLAGLAVRYIGRPISIGCRVLCSLLAGGITFAALAVSGITIASITVGFLGSLACLAVCRRSLTYEQEKALYRLRHNIGCASR